MKNLSFVSIKIIYLFIFIVVVYLFSRTRKQAHMFETKKKKDDYENCFGNDDICTNIYDRSAFNRVKRGKKTNTCFI